MMHTLTLMILMMQGVVRRISCASSKAKVKLVSATCDKSRIKRECEATIKVSPIVIGGFIVRVV